MTNVLITNIGNRNIIINGKLYYDLPISDRNSTNYKSYKDWTQEILLNYQNFHSQLDINIFKPLITVEAKPSNIVIFYSDQTRYQTRTDQDTIYEAEIIKYILIEKYQYLPEQLHLLPIEAKIIDNGGLLNFYRKALIQLRIKKYDKYLICDAGGTAQQKMALKIMMEYLFDADQFEIKYAEGNELVSDVKLDEYRSVINSELAINLINKGNYTGAAEILDFLNLSDFHNQGDWKKKLFAHTYFRFIGNRKLSEANLATMKIANPILVNYKSHIVPDGFKELSSIFSAQNLIDIMDILQRVNFYIFHHEFSLAVLSFSQFFEKMMDMHTKQLFPEEKYGTPRMRSLEQENEIIDSFSDKIKSIEPNIKIDSLAFGCILLKYSTNSLLSKFGKCLSPYLPYLSDSIRDKNISTIRNSIAHEGLVITQNDWTTKLSYVQDLILRVNNIFGIAGLNIFQELNNLLEDTIRYK